MKKYIYLVLRLVISLSAVFLLFWVMRGKIKDVVQTIKTADLFLTTICFLFGIILISILGVRLKIILSIQKAEIPLKRVIALSYIGIFFNNFMPSAVGGDVIKAYYISKQTHKKMEAFTSVFVDRLMGLVTLIFVTTVVLLVWGRSLGSPIIVKSLLALVGGSAVFIIFLANKNIARKFAFILIPLRRFGLDEKIKNIYRAVNSYAQYRRQMLYCILVSLFTQTSGMIIVYILAKALYAPIPFKIVMVVFSLTSAASILPSINGLGVREGTFVFFLKDIIGADKALALSILFLGMLIVNSIVGGFVFLTKEHFKIKEIQHDMLASQQEADEVEREEFADA